MNVPAGQLPRTDEISVSGANPTNWQLIRRLLALWWEYRLGCLVVLLQQGLVVVLGLATLGLTGLAIDVIRLHFDPNGASPAWPLGWHPPSDWTPMSVLGLLAGIIMVVALLLPG